MTDTQAIILWLDNTEYTYNYFVKNKNKFLKWNRSDIIRALRNMFGPSIDGVSVYKLSVKEFKAYLKEL